MARIDLKEAYRSVAICTNEHYLAGLKWQFRGDGAITCLSDGKLPFGPGKAQQCSVVPANDDAEKLQLCFTVG